VTTTIIKSDASIKQLDRSIRDFHHQYETGALIQMAIRVVAAFVLLVLLLFLLDAAFGFGAWGRVGLILAALAMLVGVVWHTRRRQRSQRMTYRLARMLGEEDREASNHLLNALDFREQLHTEEEKDLTRGLMQQEIHDAAEQTKGLGRLQAFKPPQLKRERNILLAALAVFILLPLLYFPLYKAETPRFLLPFGDHPPFSLTQVTVEPREAEVDYGTSLELVAAWRGRDPRSMEVVLEDMQGEELAVVPMMADSNRFFHVVPELTDDIQWHARFKGGRSHRAKATVVRAPRIEYLRAIHTAPAYSGLPEVTRQVANQTIRSWKGTTIRLLVTANQPLRACRMTFDGKTIEGAAMPDDEKTMAVSFELDRPGTFSVKVQGNLGEAWSESSECIIEIRPDEKPEVIISTPNAQSFATPSAQIPISVEATDDFGIRKMELVRNINGSRDYVKSLYEDENGSAFVNQVETLDLEDLGVQPGDVIDFYARVLDIHPEGEKPRTAATVAHRLEIISEEQHQEYMRSMKDANDLQREYKKIEDALDEVIEAQKAIEEETRELAESGELDDEAGQQALKDAQDRQEELAEHAKELAEAFRKKAEENPTWDVEEQYQETLKEMAEQLDDAAEEMQKSAQSMQQAGDAQDEQALQESQEQMAQSQEHQKSALEKLGETAEQFDQEIGQENEQLAEAYDLMKDVEDFKQMYLEQESLRRQAHSMRDEENPSAEDQARMEDLAERERELGQALEELTEDIEEHAEAIEEHSEKLAQQARDLVEGLREMEVSEDMREAGEFLAEHQAQPGHQEASEAAEDMKSLLSQCQGNGMGDPNAMCESLDLSMPGQQSLAQMAKGMGNRPGQGRGRGQGRGQGQGDAQGGSGDAGGQSFSVFGDTQDLDMPKSAQMSRSQVKADNVSKALPSDPATTVGEMRSSADRAEFQMELPPDETLIEDYRGLILEYFRSQSQEP